MTVAVALVLTIPIYAESVAFRVLTERLTEGPDRINRPPFLVLVQLYRLLERTGQSGRRRYGLDQLPAGKGRRRARLGTRRRIVRHLETQNFRLYPAGETNYRDENRSLDYVSFGTTENIAEPRSSWSKAVPIRRPLKHRPQQRGRGDDPPGLRFRIWHPGWANITTAINWRLDSPTIPCKSPCHPHRRHLAAPVTWTREYWFYRPNVFKDILLIDEATYLNRLAPFTEYGGQPGRLVPGHRWQRRQHQPRR